MKEDQDFLYKSSQVGTDRKSDERHSPLMGGGKALSQGNGGSIRTSWSELPVHSYVKIVIIGGLF
ncbi:MAG: hypothetical protein WC454_07250, partial [Phycisphaerae bacterium]